MTSYIRKAVPDFCDGLDGLAQKPFSECAKLLGLVKKEAPFIFRDSGPACVAGPCSEGEMTCGRPREIRKKFRCSWKAGLSEIVIERIESSPYSSDLEVRVKIGVVEFGGEDIVYHHGAVNIPKSIFNETIMYDRVKEYGASMFNALYNRTSEKVVVEVNKTIK